jgi:hypothetical protein
VECDLGDLQVCKPSNQLPAILGAAFGAVILIAIVVFALVKLNRTSRSDSSSSSSVMVHKVDKPEDATSTVAAVSWVNAYDVGTDTNYVVNPVTGEFIFDRPEIELVTLPASSLKADVLLAREDDSRVSSTPTNAKAEPSRQSPSSLQSSFSRILGMRSSPKSQSQENGGPWQVVMDDETGTSFWINSMTNEFSWTNPTIGEEQ